jgi:hypothetical protein
MEHRVIKSVPASRTGRRPIQFERGTHQMLDIPSIRTFTYTGTNSSVSDRELRAIHTLGGMSTRTAIKCVRSETGFGSRGYALFQTENAGAITELTKSATNGYIPAISSTAIFRHTGQFRGSAGSDDGVGTLIMRPLSPEPAPSSASCRRSVQYMISVVNSNLIGRFCSCSQGPTDKCHCPRRHSVLDFS